MTTDPKALAAAGFTEEPAPKRAKLEVEICEHQPTDLAERGYVRCRIRMDYGGWTYVSVPKAALTESV